MRIAGSKAGVKFLDFISLAIAVRITQPKNIRGLGYNDSVFVEHQGGHALQAIVKDLFVIHPAIAVPVFQPRDPISGWTGFARSRSLTC